MGMHCGHVGAEPAAKLPSTGRLPGSISTDKRNDGSPGNQPHAPVEQHWSEWAGKKLLPDGGEQRRGPRMPGMRAQLPMQLHPDGRGFRGVTLSPERLHAALEELETDSGKLLRQDRS